MGSETISAVATERGSNVRAAISRAAARTGVDFGYLYNQARAESGLNPNAKARSSSAAGLFQFLDQTWLSTVKSHGAEHGYGWAADAITRTRTGRMVVNDPEARRAIMSLRLDPDASSAMAAEFASDNARRLQTKIDRPLNSTDLYFAHFLGAGGATSFLTAADRNPDAAAAPAFPRAAAANRSIFYKKDGTARTYAEIYSLMGRKIRGDGTAPKLGPATQYASAPTTTSPIEAQIQSQVQALQQAALPQAGDTPNAPVRIDMLRPSPQSARLAYMLIVNTLDA